MAVDDLTMPDRSGVVCECPATPLGGHTMADHDSDCYGWTFSGSPCGGCLRCIAMQAMRLDWLDRLGEG